MKNRINVTLGKNVDGSNYVWSFQVSDKLPEGYAMMVTGDQNRIRKVIMLLARHYNRGGRADKYNFVASTFAVVQRQDGSLVIAVRDNGASNAMLYYGIVCGAERRRK